MPRDHDMLSNLQNYEYPFCKAFGRSPTRLATKLRWRKADQKADAEGAPTDLTLWASEARENLFVLLSLAIDRDAFFRVRHRFHDLPCLIMRETRFRELERRASDAQKEAEAARARAMAAEEEASRRPPVTS